MAFLGDFDAPSTEESIGVFEYKTHLLGTESNVERELNTLGSNGWELIQVIPGYNGYSVLYIFKKERSDAKR